MGNALHTHGGVTDARQARIAQAGLLAVQGPTALDARTGVLAGPGSTALVTGTSATSPMTVAIAPHHWVTTRGAANGPYLGALEAATTAPVAAAPASGTRTDVVWSKQQDATAGIPTPDATTGPLYGVTTGTVGSGKPTIPVGAEELATVAVSAGATSTGGANVLITNTARQTVARGARVPVRNQAERDALLVYPGLEVFRLDLGSVELYVGGATPWRTTTDAAAWQTYTPAWTAAGATTQPNIGNGTLTGRFRRLDAVTGVFRLLMALGTTSGGGNGTLYSFSLPPGWTVGPSVPAVIPGWFKSGADEGPLTGFVASSGNTIYPIRADLNNSAIGNGLLDGPGQFITLGGTVELA